jgi:hypothetical protein
MKPQNVLNTTEYTAGAATPLSDWKIGAGDRDRTGDIQLGKLAFYR